MIVDDETAAALVGELVGRYASGDRISITEAQVLIESLVPYETIITIRRCVGPEDHPLAGRRCWRATAWIPGADPREVARHHERWDDALVALAVAVEHERRRGKTPPPTPHFQ